MTLDTSSSPKSSITDELAPPSTASEPLPTIEGNLCSVCHYPSWTVGIDHADTYTIDARQSLRSSAELGCPRCKILDQAWDCAKADRDDEHKEWINFRKSSGNLHLQFWGPAGIHDVDIFTLEYAPRFKDIPVASLIPPSTSLNLNFDKIRQWLLDCEQQHKDCQAGSLSVPPRLLDLQSDVIDAVRIVELRKDPSEHDISPAHIRYACLSHCWGNSRSKHLTRSSNLDKNKTGIPITELPLTFRDAIDVSRALNIRYLWIDSLCVVQDDIIDWENHVEIMADIYRDAHITLAAGASEDDEGGFFRGCEELYMDSRSFKIADGQTECEIYVRRCLPHPDEKSPQRTTMPLMSRGWVFQERLLSRRFLCFARNEILWECQEDVACSCSTSDTGFNHRDPKKNPGFLNCSPVKSKFATISQLSKNDLWSLWRDVVAQYSTRKLTYPQDKMPALAGFARRFEAAGAGTYLYGLWLEALETQLLWVMSKISEQESRPRNAPSWSWVSAADGDVEWRIDDPRKSGWKVMSTPVRDAVTGSQADGSNLFQLTVRGNVSHVSLKLEKSASRFQIGHLDVFLHPAPSTISSRVRDLTIQRYFIPIHLSSRSIDEKWFRNYSGRFTADYKFWTDESSLLNILGDVHFLETGIEDRSGPPENYDASSGWPRWCCWVTGLILRQTAPGGDANIPSFERIGHLKFNIYIPEDHWKHIGVDTTFSFV